MFWLGSLISHVLQCHAVPGIDLKPRFAIFLRTGKDFIDAGGAVPLRRFPVLRQIDSNRNVLIAELQMARLVLFVVGPGKADVRQAVEADDTVGHWIGDRTVIDRTFG